MIELLLKNMLEKYLREHETQLKLKVRGQTAEAGFESGVRATLSALKEVFSRTEYAEELKEAVLMEATLLTHSSPHPRSRIYRSEPALWTIEDVNLGELWPKLKAQISKASNPVAVFDLDGTLFDVSHRTVGILKEWLNTLEAKKFAKATLRRLDHVALCHMGYSLAHAFENLGFDIRDEDVSNVLFCAERFWRKKFFDGKTLVEFDTPIPGSQTFVKALQAHGVHICYLTGRDHRGMHQGTLQQLNKHNFPLENCTLLLKQNHDEEDHVFKCETMQELAKKFDIVANFENEYINLGQMIQHAKHALHVVLDTQHSGRPVQPLAKQVYRLQNFRDETIAQ